MVEQLLEAGADKDAKTSSGATAALIARRAGYDSVVEALGESIEEVDASRVTMASVASKEDDGQSAEESKAKKELEWL